MMKFRITRRHGRCAICKKHSMQRIHRNRWMKMFPGTKLLSCYNCRSKEYVFFKYFSVILKNKQ